MVTVEIRIGLKEGVTDPEGVNVNKVLNLLGFKAVKSVRSVKIFEVDIDLPAIDAKTAGEEMCQKILANPVIQNFTVSVR